MLFESLYFDLRPPKTDLDQWTKEKTTWAKSYKMHLYNFIPVFEWNQRVLKSPLYIDNVWLKSHILAFPPKSDRDQWTATSKLAISQVFN